MKYRSSVLALAVIAVCQFFLTGCANPYADHYATFIHVSPSERNPNPTIVGCAPENADTILQQYLNAGFQTIGRSEFYDDKQYIKDSYAFVRSQATNVCADAAVYWVGYSHTEDQSYEEDVPREEKITTYHSNGRKTKTVIESTETRYVQKYVDMYRYVAVFLKRRSSGTAAPAVAIPVNY